MVAYSMLVVEIPLLVLIKDRNACYVSKLTKTVFTSQ